MRTKDVEPVKMLRFLIKTSRFSFFGGNWLRELSLASVYTCSFMANDVSILLNMEIGQLHKDLPVTDSPFLTLFFTSLTSNFGGFQDHFSILCSFIFRYLETP